MSEVLDPNSPHREVPLGLRAAMYGMVGIHAWAFPWYFQGKVDARSGRPSGACTCGTVCTFDNVIAHAGIPYAIARCKDCGKFYWMEVVAVEQAAKAEKQAFKQRVRKSR